MNFIERLREEHEQIERELLELEEIMEAKELNYPNLIHVYKKLHDFWNEHELKEEKIFPILEHEQIVIPVKTMLFEHSDLRIHKSAIINALNFNSEEVIKKTLENHGVILIKKLRDHIDKEDEILYRITLECFTSQEIAEAEERIR
jgi:DUF438 domain-containing protein